jgi:hypothetical protein
MAPHLAVAAGVAIDPPLGEQALLAGGLERLAFQQAQLFGAPPATRTASA